VQSGTANGVNVNTLFSLGYLYYEPLWVFYRGEREWDRLTQLKGRRIAVGAEGSGTRKLALQLLEANGVDAKNASLLPLGGLSAVAALQDRTADVVFRGGAERSAAVWSLLYAEGVRLMSRVENRPSAEVHIGQRVRARVLVNEGRGLVVFDVIDGDGMDTSHPSRRGD
jgi:TRAP-type uncharacterized transport system substrate-binding protein